MAVAKNNLLPWSNAPGTKGVTVATRQDMQRRARLFLESPEYEKYLQDKIKNNDLAPAVEIMLYHYAYGKPTENINLNVTEDFSKLSTMDLKDRAARAFEALKEAEALEAAIEAELVSTQNP